VPSAHRNGSAGVQDEGDIVVVVEPMYVVVGVVGPAEYTVVGVVGPAEVVPPVGGATYAVV